MGQGEDVESPQVADAVPDEVPDEAEVALGVGNKIIYKVGAKSYTQKVTSIDKVKETIDTSLHKNVPLSDIIELVE